MSVAVGVLLSDGVIASAAMALGGVAPKPWRLVESEAALVGKAPGPQAFRAAARAAMSSAQPLSQNAFKIDLARQAVVRALTLATGATG